MSILNELDPRTLMVSQDLTAALFTVVFLVIWRMHPQMRGSFSMALSFLTATVGLTVSSLRGAIPVTLAILVGNLLVNVCFVFQYDAVLQFFLATRRKRLFGLYASSLIGLVATAVVWYFATVRIDIVPRSVAMALAGGIVRVMIGVEIYRRSTGRAVLRLYAIVFFITGAFSLHRAIATAVYGSPQDFLQKDTVQILNMVLSVVYICAVGTFFLVLVSRELTSALEHRAHHDPVTGVLNRRGVQDRLQVLLEQLPRNGSPLSTLLIDLDQFKEINDTHGHATGDHVLYAIAQSIAAQIRSVDLLGRYGGDELLLVLPQTAAREAQLFADRLLMAISQERARERDLPLPTVSIGIAEAVPGDSVLSVLQRSDDALYEAKRAGRNRARYRSAAGAAQDQVGTGSSTAASQDKNLPNQSAAARA